MKIRAMIVTGLLLLGTRIGFAADAAEEPSPSPVAGFVAPAPGEHPRLFFRKSDLPEIRRRAQTPEGQAIVKRLRVLLNGSDGESMPTVFNGSAKAYGGNAPVKKDEKGDKGGGGDDKDAPASGKG